GGRNGDRRGSRGCHKLLAGIGHGLVLSLSGARLPPALAHAVREPIFPENGGHGTLQGAYIGITDRERAAQVRAEQGGPPRRLAPGNVVVEQEIASLAIRKRIPRERQVIDAAGAREVGKLAAVAVGGTVVGEE